MRKTSGKIGGIGVAMAAVVMALGVGGTALGEDKKVKKEEYLDFNYGEPLANKADANKWVQSIKVVTPEYRSDVKGDVTVTFDAPGMTAAKAMCWQQPTDADPNPWGHDQVVASNISLDANGRGTFVFKADEFPNGPTNLRIFAHGDGDKRDICELQLYNTGGVKWNQGIPKSDPPGAKGLKLVFSEDFDGPLSITNDGKGAKFGAHKPGGGDFSGWHFASPEHPNKPFRQRDTYLQIAARKTDKDKGSSGLISTVAQDGTGFWAKAPFYAECRFVAQSAPGTWPAFWTITQMHGVDKPSDELDIVEAYGGVGKTIRGEPTPHHPGYSIVTHFWRQTEPDGSKRKAISKRVDAMEIGSKSYFSTTFHTYAVYVDEKDTIYYYDDIEVHRHPTNKESLNPHILMVNYAIGGISGWKIDLERYGNGTDMYVDYLRVYQKE